MRVTLTPDEERVAQETRRFLEAALPELPAEPTDYAERVEHLRAWQRRVHDAGLLGLSWPTTAGGRGSSPMQQVLVNEEMARAGAPPILGSVGLDIVGPSIIEHGTERQRSELLPGILSGDELWCQGFSEPDSGSDLASMQATARLDDDHFVLDGHKVWTSYAMHASWCAVLARTRSDGRAHESISYLLVDMASPGVSVRPLVQVTGDPEFGEVHFNGVLVPRECLLGDLHEGWGIAMHTLSYERGWYGLNRQVVLRALLHRLVQDAIAVGGRDLLADGAASRSIARASIALQVLRHQGIRSVHAEPTHGGAESSVDKVLLAEAEQAVGRAVLDVLGEEILLDGGGPAGLGAAHWRNVYLYGRAASVYGGSVQIQRNIIAQRLLDLPKAA